MVYSEFLEALCAMSQFKQCNPYMPMDQRYSTDQ